MEPASYARFQLPALPDSIGLEARPGMKAKCIQCGAIVQAPDKLIEVPATTVSPEILENPIERSPILGIASLVAFCAALLLGIGMTQSLARGGGAAAFGAVAGIGFGAIASVLGVALAVAAIIRSETPRWPGVLGFGLGLFPASFGLWLLWELLKHWYAG